jgi:hypothetical protein
MGPAYTMRSVALTCSLVFSAFAFSGCIIPYPHTSQSSPEVRGRIVDEATRNPVGGAEVSVHGRPATRVLSDGTGQFLLPEHHNFHLFITASPCADSLPHGKPYSDTIDIRCRGYAPIQFDAHRQASHVQDWPFGLPMTLRDILLVSTNR